MPIPLNGSSEISRAWLAKTLGYMLDDTLPVKLSSTPTDIDFLGIHPSLQEVLALGNAVKIKPRIVVEVKGWLDYDRSELLKGLYHDLSLMKGDFIPKVCTKEKDEFTFTFLKEEVFNRATEIFKPFIFDRVLIVPTMPFDCRYKWAKGGMVDKGTLINDCKSKGIIVLELGDIITDLIRYVKADSKKPGLENAMNRRSFVLEIIHALQDAQMLKDSIL
jgi:hypothetical protein